MIRDSIFKRSNQVKTGKTELFVVCPNPYLRLTDWTDTAFDFQRTVILKLNLGLVGLPALRVINTPAVPFILLFLKAPKHFTTVK